MNVKKLWRKRKNKLKEVICWRRPWTGKTKSTWSHWLRETRRRSKSRICAKRRWTRRVQQEAKSTSSYRRRLISWARDSSVHSVGSTIEKLYYHVIICSAKNAWLITWSQDRDTAHYVAWKSKIAISRESLGVMMANEVSKQLMNNLFTNEVY